MINNEEYPTDYERSLGKEPAPQRTILNPKEKVSAATVEILLNKAEQAVNAPEAMQFAQAAANAANALATLKSQGINL